jgi:hypothetical protein
MCEIVTIFLQDLYLKLFAIITFKHHTDSKFWTFKEFEWTREYNLDIRKKLWDEI